MISDKFLGKYVIVRSDRAGVFAGTLVEVGGNRQQNVVMENARRIWYWAGAASLSQLAVDGTSKPKECKFPVETSMEYILDVIEIILVTSKAQESIKNVPIWSE